MTQLEAIEGRLVSPAAGRKGAGRIVIAALLVAYAAALAAGWWAVIRFLPDHVTLQLLGHTKEVENLHTKLISNAGLLLAILPSAVAIECMTVGWEYSSIRRLLFARTPSMKTDLSVLFLGQAHVLDIVGRVLMLGASMVSGIWLHDLMASKLGIDIDPSGLPFAAQLVIYFYIYTFFDYWTHRLDHSRFFWPLHRFHHSAEDFCVVTSARQHPAAFSAFFVINLPLAILGATPSVMIFVSVLVTTVGFLIHSQLTSDWGWVGRWVLQSPLHHRLHHKLDMTEPTGHFAMAPIWDRLFGTWRGTADPALAIGVTQPYRHGFWIVPDLLRDYWHFWSGFVVKRAD